MATIKLFLLGLVLALGLSGRAADEQAPAPVEEKSIIFRPETFAVCKAIDVASTIYIVKHGGEELNPLLKGSVNAHHFMPLVLLSWGLYELIKWAKNDNATAVANAVTCGVALNNLAVIGRM